MKSLVIWILTGAIIGGVAASFIVPPMLSWYNEAGYLSQNGQPAAVVNLPNVVRYATDRLIRGQAIGAGIGAVLFAVLGMVVGGRGRARKTATPTPVEPVH
jgi:cytosine/uracil/thiamine/allantoin permease